MMVVNHHRDDDGEYQEAFISSKLSLFFSLSLTTRSIIISVNVICYNVVVVLLRIEKVVVVCV